MAGRLLVTVIVIPLLLSILKGDIIAYTQTAPSATCMIITPSGGVINLEPLANHRGAHRLVTSNLESVFSFDPCPLLSTNASNSNTSRIQSILVASVFYLRDRAKTRNISLGTTDNVLPPKFKPNVGCHAKLPHFTPTRKYCSLVTPPQPRTISEEHQPKNVQASVMDIALPTVGSHVGNDDVTHSRWKRDQAVDDNDDNEDDNNRDTVSSSGTAESERDDSNVDKDLPAKKEHTRKRHHIRSRPHPENITAVLRFKMSKGRCKDLRSYVLLQCDRGLTGPQQAVFQRWDPDCSGHLYFILTHKCCCEEGCVTEAARHTLLQTDRAAGTSSDGTIDRTMPSHQISKSNLVDWLQKRGFKGNNLTDFEEYIDGLFETGTEATGVGEEGAPKLMWLIVVVNIGVVWAAICIAAVCCRSGGGAIGTTHGPYGYLPALHSSRLTLASSVESFFGQPFSAPAKSAEFLDYSSSIARSNKLPQLSDCTLESADLEIGQRLGGGLFGDTYLAEWKDRTVAAKRLTVGVHQGQMDDLDRKWIINEVEILSRHRHKNLVAVFGVVLDSRQPYVISEFVECESLKDHLTRKIDGSFTWIKKVKICSQAADAMVFLHSAKPPIIHRDLRCANILIDRYDKVKVVDHALTKITQRLRQGCSGRKGCYCQKDICALPASFRWTSPELLSNPQAEETEHDVITEECDVYSYAMVLWEVASHCDPFEDIPDENEVRELVIADVRPRVDILIGLIPQLKELMIACWDNNRENRPPFRQIAIHLKTCQQILIKTAHKPHTRNNSSTTYLKSTLNMTT